MISFTAKSKEFKKLLEKLKVFYKYRRAEQIRATCEITLTNGLVTLAIPGAVFNMNAETKGTAKATLPFSKLYSIIDHHSYEEIRVEFLDQLLIFGSVQAKAQTTFFLTDKILRTIRLPINYTDLDLLRLKTEGYTKEELDFNNLTGMIEQAERRVYYNIRRAAGYLREYGIMPKEIKSFLMERLSIQLDLDKTDIKLLLSSE